VLNAFVEGTLTIVLPLLMLERKISIVTIGLVYASLPMIFLFTRVIFAALSDMIGRKIFFILNGMLNSLNVLFYYFAFTPLEFLSGKITEGVKDASIWSVNRAFLLEHSKDKRKMLSQMMAINYVSIAFGSLIAGFLIAWIFYSNTLIFCLLISLLLIPVSFLLQETYEKRLEVRSFLDFLDLRRREESFKRFLLFFLLTGLAYGFIGLPTGGYILPIFLLENGFDSKTIGVLISLHMLITGLSIPFFVKMKIEKVLLYGGLFSSFVLFLLGLARYFWGVFLILLLGIAMGIIHSVQEGIFSKATRDESYGSDIGLLMMGLHAGRTVSLAFSGFLIASFGFVAPFWLSALIFLIISLFFLV